VPERAPRWEAPDVHRGTRVADLGPLFVKVELDPED
jgi:hypothetical protein